jgi:hypothetical protein
MKKVIDYIVVRECSILNLESSVKKHIKNGRQPIGGITVDKDEYYLQAMVEYEEVYETNN